MNKRVFLIAIASVFLASSAMAEKMQTFKSGSKLQMECSGLNAPLKSDTKALLDATCLNYIKGVFDLHQTLVGSRVIEPRICKPTDVDLGQLARITIEYLEKNQEKAEVTASSLVMHALSEAYPCSEESQSN